jgi:hypothetical protein
MSKENRKLKNTARTTICLFEVFLTLCVFVSLCNSQDAKTKTLTPIEDSFVMSDIPPPWESQGYNKGRNQNFGESTLLYAWNDYDYHSLVFMKFDLSSIPADSSIESATLKLHTPDLKPIDSTLVSVYFCSDNSWSELDICWNNKPPFASNSLDAVMVVAPKEGDVVIKGHWYSWDVTTACKTPFLGTNQKISLVVDSEHSEQTRWYPPTFSSRETSYKPQLIVSYIESQPQQPTTNGKDVGLIAIGAVILMSIAVVFYILVKKRNAEKL